MTIEVTHADEVCECKLFQRAVPVSPIAFAADDKAPADLTLALGLVWKVALPAGFSSPIMVRNRVVLTGWEGNDRIVLALDAVSGKEASRRTFPRARDVFKNEANSHSTPSMGSDGNNVYAYFHDPALMSFTFGAGRRRWSRSTRCMGY